jgi:hypothetical protein
MGRLTDDGPRMKIMAHIANGHEALAFGIDYDFPNIVVMV